MHIQYIARHIELVVIWSMIFLNFITTQKLPTVTLDRLLDTLTAAPLADSTAGQNIGKVSPAQSAAAFYAFFLHTSTYVPYIIKF